MGPVLLSRQAEELHKSIIAYLSAKNLRNSAAVLREELNLSEDAFDATTAKTYETLLERKWTSIIMELESRNAALQSELESATPNSLSSRNQDSTSWLPGTVPRHSLQSHRDAINCIAFHPIFSSVASGSDDCSLKIWDWELGELEKTIKGHTRAVSDVDYGGPRGGVLLASCSTDLTIKLWDPADDYKNIRTLLGHNHSVSAIRFIPSGAVNAPTFGNLLVSASRDKVLKIWEVTSGCCVKTLQGHTGWVRDVCPSLDGRFIFSTGDDMTARLWDISPSNPLNTMTMVGHEHFIECCEFAPPASYQHLAVLAGLKKSLPARGTAEFMATGSRDKNIKIWDAHGRCLRTLVGHDNWVRALAFHPGGRYLFSVSDDKTLRCWDLSQEGKCVKVLRDAHERFVTCLRWAPGILRDAAVVLGLASDSRNGESQEMAKSTNVGVNTSVVHIRCVIATGGVDRTLRVFAN